MAKRMKINVSPGKIEVSDGMWAWIDKAAGEQPAIVHEIPAMLQDEQINPRWLRTWQAWLEDDDDETLFPISPVYIWDLKEHHDWRGTTTKVYATMLCSDEQRHIVELDIWEHGGGYDEAPDWEVNWKWMDLE